MALQVELRKVSGGCPACIMAALRQSNTFSSGFSWKDESKSWLEEHKEEHLGAGMGSCQ